MFEDWINTFLVLTYNPEEIQAIKETIENNDFDQNDDLPFYWLVYSPGVIERLSLQLDGNLINAGFGILDGSIFVYSNK